MLKTIRRRALRFIFFFPELYPPLSRVISTHMLKDVELEEIPTFESQRTPLFILLTFTCLLSFSANYFGFNPAIYLSLILNFIAIILIVSLNYRTVQIQSWYRHLSASEHNLIKDSFYPDLNKLETNKAQREALQKTPPWGYVCDCLRKRAHMHV